MSKSYINLNKKKTLKYYFLLYMYFLYYNILYYYSQKIDYKEKLNNNLNIEDIEFESKLNTIFQDGFDFEFSYNVVIPQNKKYTFYQDVYKNSTFLKGLFTAYNDQVKSTIKFDIYNNNKELLFSSIGKKNDVFNIEIKKAGRYYLVFDNSNNFDIHLASIYLNSGQNNLLTSNELNNTHDRVKNIDVFINNMVKEQEFLGHRFKERVKSNFIN